MENNKLGFVYILQSLKNGRFYIGSTDNLQRRVDEHLKGKSTYTRQLLPLKPVFSQQVESLSEARKIERKLKRLKSRKIIEQIVQDGRIKKSFSS